MPIMWGLAIGAAMGGGIAALRGGKTDDILKGALMGGATGAIGGGISSLMPAATGGVTGAATVATPASTALTGSTAASAVSPALAAQAPSMSSLFANASAPLSGVTSSVPTIASTGTNLATSQAANSAGTGFFSSGIGKTIADNKGMIGLGGLGLMALKPQGSGGQNQEQDSFIRPHTYDPNTQTYTAQTPIKASEFGSRTFANGGAVYMAEGGETEAGIGSFMQEQFNNRANQTTSPMAQQRESNPTLEALAEIQRSQQAFQPQGITQPLIQPQMAQIQQRYAAPQRQAPEAFQYQAPSFVKYANTPAPYTYTPPPPPPPTPIAPPVTGVLPANKPTTTTPSNSTGKPYTLPGGSNPANVYAGPGMNGDKESYYDRYPVAPVYDYVDNTPTRPDNPTSGSPEINVPSNVPVSVSSGLADIQQDFANQGYTDFIPDATTDYSGNTGGANGGLVYNYAMGGGIGGYYPEPDDGDRQLGVAGLNQGPQYPMQGIGYAMGGHLGGYSDGGQLLRGPGDGVSDDIPAQIGNRQPARLADGEFVVPARIVSELGNGSTDAGAKRLYAMMDRIQKNRGKTVGKGKVAVNSKSDKYLPA